MEYESLSVEYESLSVEYESMRRMGFGGLMGLYFESMRIRCGLLLALEDFSSPRRKCHRSASSSLEMVARYGVVCFVLASRI